MKMTTKTYWVRLPVPVAKRLKAQAKAQRMSRASYMAKRLEEIANEAATVK